MRCIFLPAAQMDLLEIATYIARDNPTQAFAFTDKLEEFCKALIFNPRIGRERPEAGQNIRSCIFKNYVIFYSVGDDSVAIIHIIHGARDIERLLEDEF